MIKSHFILGVRVHSSSLAEVLEFLASNLAEKGEKFFIVTPNPEIIVAAQKNKKLLEALNSSTLSLPDGVGLKLFEPSLKIIKGRELMVKLFGLANEKKLKIFLLGSHEKTIDKSLALLSKLYSNVIARGASGPRLNQTARPITAREAKLEIGAIEKINNFKPDILFVAFGAPKQELWVQKHFSQLKIGGVMVVGGSLDVFSGVKKAPPQFLANLGLEWLWRLFREPKRIGRIFTAVVVFPLLYLLKRR